MNEEQLEPLSRAERNDRRVEGGRGKTSVLR